MPATRGKKAAAAKAAAAEAEDEPPKEGAAAAEAEAPAPAPAPAPKASPTRGRGKKRSAPEPEPEPEPEPAPEPAAADPPAPAPAAAEAAAPAPAPAPAAKAPAAKAPSAKAPAAAAAAKSTDAVEEPPAKRQVLPPRVHDVTVLLPIDAVGLIIGKGGLTMKRLVEESGAAIRVQEYMDMAKNSKQRGVTIRGNFEVRARVRFNRGIVESPHVRSACALTHSTHTHAHTHMYTATGDRAGGAGDHGPAPATTAEGGGACVRRREPVGPDATDLAISTHLTRLKRPRPRPWPRQ